MSDILSRLRHWTDSRARWLRAAASKTDARRVRCTAAGVALLSLVTMFPALRHWDLAVAPPWARVVLLLGLLQLAYAAWLASVPDWAALWAVMFVLAGIATLYGAAAAAALALPPHDDLPLGLSAVRGSAPLWCAIIATLTVAAAYWCGHWAQVMRRGAPTPSASGRG